MSDFSNFIQGQITKKKLEKGLEMLHNESPAELRKKLQNVNINEALQKIDEYDKRRLNELGINLNELKGRITESDIQKIYQVLGRDSEMVIRKIICSLDLLRLPVFGAKTHLKLPKIIGVAT